MRSGTDVVVRRAGVRFISKVFRRTEVRRFESFHDNHIYTRSWWSLLCAPERWDIINYLLAVPRVKRGGIYRAHSQISKLTWWKKEKQGSPKV